jgi:hypothetical protein
LPSGWPEGRSPSGAEQKQPKGRKNAELSCGPHADVVPSCLKRPQTAATSSQGAITQPE